MSYTAIIFDLDGTIIDTEVLWDECSVEFLEAHGAVYNLADTKHLLMGRSLEEGAEIMRDHYGFTGDPKILAQERRVIFERLLEREVAFIPGFKEFFDRVKDNYKLAVGTSMERPFIERVERHLDLSHYFGDHIYSVSDIGFITKPNPDIFLYAAKKIGVIHADCLVIEDAPNGILAAKAAGMDCVGITTSTSAARLKAAGADQVVNQYLDIKL